MVQCEHDTQKDKEDVPTEKKMSNQSFVVKALFSPGAHLGSVLKLYMGYYTAPTMKHDWSVQTKMKKQKKPAIEMKDGSKLRCYILVIKQNKCDLETYSSVDTYTT